MKEFLTQISELLSYISEGDISAVDTNSKLRESYFGMSSDEKQNAFRSLRDILLEYSNLYFEVLFYCACIIKDDEILAECFEAIGKMRVSVTEKITYFSCVESFIFREKSDFSNHDSALKQYRKILGDIDFDVITDANQKEKREKPCVLFTIQPLLSISHAPSNLLVSLAQYYEKLGYEVKIVSVSYRKCDKVFLGQIPFTYCMNSLSEESVWFNYTYKDISLQVYNHLFSSDSFMKEMQMLCQYAISLNPDYVVAIGAENWYADVLARYLKVVTLLTSSAESPNCNSQYIIDYFHASDYRFKNIVAEKVFYWKWKDYENTVVEDRKEIRRKYNLPEDAFIILISGTRLNVEITEPYVSKVLLPILEKEEEIIIAFMGVETLDVPTLKDYFSSERCRCLGMSKNYRSDLNLADLHLNTQRAGGGSGPGFSALMGIPVITLSNCDGAYAVNSEYTVDSLEDYLPLISRYVHDKKFYKERSRKMKQYALEREATQDIMINQINNLTKFIMNEND